MANPNWTDGSDDWTTAADWSTGTVPGATDDVTVAQGDPEVTTNVGTVASIAIGTSGALEVGSGGALATTGALTSTGAILVDEGGSFSVGATAGFGTAGVLDGQVQLELGGVLQFATGQITSIAGDGSLTIIDGQSYLSDAATPGSNSALGGLASIAGTLSLANSASVTTTGPMTISGTLTLQSASLAAGGAVTNAATGSITLSGGGTATPANLIVAAPAQLGSTAGVIDGKVELDGNALIQFASGQITTIASDGSLTLDGTNNVIADAGAATSDSALTGLADNAGTLSLISASLTTNTALANTGTLDLFETASLATGALTNTGALSFAGGTYTVNGTLANTGSIGLNTNAALVENQPSSLIVHAEAGFGTAGVVQGHVDLEGSALVQFDSGQITTIAQGASLTLGDSTADVADADATTSNSALAGLTDNAGTLTLEDGATIDTSGPLTNTGAIDLTNFFENGTAPTLDINSAAGFGTAGVLDGSVEIGGAADTGGLLEFASGQITSIAADGSLSLSGPNAFLADAGATTSNSALALASNAGTLSLTDASVTTPGALSSTGTINLTGVNSTAALDVNAAAGFGTAGVLTGQVNLAGNSLLEFASGQITSIAANSSLSIDGPDAFVADAGSSTSNSALTGLSSNAGNIDLTNGASVSCDLSSSGTIGVASATGSGCGPLTDDERSQLNEDLVFGGFGSGSGYFSQSLAANAADAAALDNTGTLTVGNSELSSSGGVIVNGTLSNTGTITVVGSEELGTGQTPNIAVLTIAAPASFGTSGVLTGQVSLAGYSLVQFASGQITSIAADSGLSISGPNAFIADGSATTVADAMALDSDSALALTSNAGTLALSNGAALTVAAGTTLASTGTVLLDDDPNVPGESGSTLTIAGTLSSSGTVTIANGSGTGTTVDGAGTLALTGGAATINAGATVSVAQIEIAGPATLELAGGTTTSAIAFTPGAGGILKIDAPVLPATGGTFANPISGFAAGDTIDIAGLVYAGTPIALYDGSTLSVTEGGVTDTLTVSATGLPVFTAESDGDGGTDITIVCFAAGTRIRTVAGDVAVEALAVGDLVVTAAGERRPIRWLGHRTTLCRRHPRPNEVMPIRIAAHAFGSGRPSRDLYVSPGHAICVDVLGEVLMPACALLNGTSIVQVEVDRITYWHVELDSHDLLLAENLPAESYLEMGNRGFFAGAAAMMLHAAPDAPIATHADFCRPFHAAGALVEAVRRATRATAVRPRRAA